MAGEAPAVWGGERTGDATDLGLAGADRGMEDLFKAPRPGGFVGVGDCEFEFVPESVVRCFGLTDKVGAFGATWGLPDPLVVLLCFVERERSVCGGVAVLEAKIRVGGRGSLNSLN